MLTAAWVAEAGAARTAAADMAGASCDAAAADSEPYDLHSVRLNLEVELPREER